MVLLKYALPVLAAGQLAFGDSCELSGNLIKADGKLTEIQSSLR